MDHVSLFLLAVGAILLIGALGEVIFQRTNIPDVIWLILAGLLLGPLLGFVTRERLDVIAPYFAAVTLVVVLFEGGSTLRLGELGRAAPRSTLLAVSSFVCSVLAVTGFAWLAAWLGLLPEGWTLQHGLLLGTILGGSSSIIIMPAMAQAKLDPRLANLVNVESAMTDAFCVVGTSALIDLMLRGVEGAAAPALALLGSFGIGAVVGLIAGTFWLLFLKLLKSNEHAYPVTLAALLFLYVLIDKLGGSAAIGILTVAIILGNAQSLGKKLGLAHEVELDHGVRGFHRQLSFIIKSFFFVFIGAMIGPPLPLILLGVVLGAVLFLARLPAVELALARSGLGPDAKKVTRIALPRGMAAGVLATLPVSAGVPGTEVLPTLVFACVLTTILIFAVGFPLARRGMPAVIGPNSGAALPAGAARSALVTAGPSRSEEVVPGGGAATPAQIGGPVCSPIAGGATTKEEARDE